MDNVLQITAWIPLTDADETNGCLEVRKLVSSMIFLSAYLKFCFQVLKGGHKTGKVAPHLGCWRDTWYIYMDPNKIEDTLGSCILFLYFLCY